MGGKGGEHAPQYTLFMHGIGILFCPSIPTGQTHLPAFLLAYASCQVEERLLR